MNGGALVIVTTSYPIEGNGREAAGSFVADLAAHLARYVPVRVVAPGVASGWEMGDDGVEVFRFSAPHGPLANLKPWRLRDLREIRRVLAAGQVATERAVKNGPVAHVLALWALPSGYWARRVASKFGLPYSVWTLGSDIWTLGRLPLVRTALRWVLRDAQHCFSDGLQLAEDTARIGGREVGFLPSTRSLRRVRETEMKQAAPYRLLFLGRWHRNKGADLLIEALELLDDADWAQIETVEIFGGGSLAPAMEAGVERLRIAGRPVALGGFLEKGAAEAAILRTDYVLIPSRVESIPVIFSDAVKLGCPVVAMPVGDLSALIRQDGCGVCANRADAASFAEALGRALRSAPAAYAEGVAKAAKRFDMEQAIVAPLLTLARLPVDAP